MRRVPLLVLLLLGSVLAARAEEEATPGIVVVNVTSGEVVRQPAIILRGLTGDSAVGEVRVLNLSRQDHEVPWIGSVEDGRFRALVGLAEGENRLFVRCGDRAARLDLTYQPAKTPYRARVFYLVPAEGDTEFSAPVDDPQDFEARIGTTMDVVQAFMADSMQQRGWGRRAFALERTPAARVRVRTIRADGSLAECLALRPHEIYGLAARAIEQDGGGFDPSYKNLVLVGFSRPGEKPGEILGHVALGGGALAVMGGVGLFSWPRDLRDVSRALSDERLLDLTRVVDDSSGRGTFWGQASTTMGATLHELCHTLGTNHCRNGDCVMTRGFDRFFTAFVDSIPSKPKRPGRRPLDPAHVTCVCDCCAANLAWSRWLPADPRRWTDENRPTLAYDPNAKAVVIESPNGIRFVGTENDGSVLLRSYPAETGAPKELRIPVTELVAVEDPLRVVLRVVDEQGLAVNERLADTVPLPAFIHTWRFARSTKPWPSPDEWPELRRGAVLEMLKDAVGRPRRGTGASYVDVREAMGEPCVSASAFALRRIRCDEETAVVAKVGGERAMRIWLNATSVFEALDLDGNRPDRHSFEMTLRKGRNDLLVELAQQRGRWGMYVRLERPDGTRLTLDDAGRLHALPTHPRAR